MDFFFALFGYFRVFARVLLIIAFSTCSSQYLVMIGYSDSAKDAGRLAASWAQYETQEALVSTDRVWRVCGMSLPPYNSDFFGFRFAFLLPIGKPR